MLDKLSQIKASFDQNSDHVKELVDFDRIILGVCITHIEELNNNLKNLGIENANMLANKTLKLLNSVRENDSMRIKYKSIFNQCLVLLVSHFSVTMEDFFKNSIDILIKKKKGNFESIEDSIKFNFAELMEYNFNLSDHFGDILLQKKNISFQDMQSINRSFEQFLSFSLPNDNNLNNVIFAQAARHSIVHSSGIADKKFIYQIRKTSPRDIQPSINENERIEIHPDEIEIISDSMKSILVFSIQSINKQCLGSN